MKRLIAFLFLSAGLWGIGQISDFDFLSFNPIESVTYVTSSKVCEAECVQNGNDFYYTFDSQSAKSNASEFQNAKAIILNIKKIELSKVEKFYRIDTYSCSDIEGMKVYEGYTNLYKNYKTVNHKKVNVQIAVKDDCIIVGFPMILTSF